MVINILIIINKYKVKNSQKIHIVFLIFDF